MSKLPLDLLSGRCDEPEVVARNYRRAIAALESGCFTGISPDAVSTLLEQLRAHLHTLEQPPPSSPPAPHS